MNKINLINLLPDVFQGRNDIHSKVWLNDIEFVKGEYYLLEANSGTGKSSLLSYIYGYRTDYQGKILFDDEDVHNLSIGQWTMLRKKHISLVWQELRLFTELTALENVRIKNSLTGHQKKKTIENWFDILGIAEKKDTLVAKMSYGQQQRVALIRALCQPFDFLMLDEPISHLDEANSAIMSNVIMEEVKKQGAAIIATSIGKRLELPYNHILNL
mgnify:CR=1 FL=1